MGQTVYVLMYSVSNRGDREETAGVYSSLERAREAMRNDIEVSKRDNFWWDTESESANEDYIIINDEYSFDAYEKGDYDYNHESWSIEPQEMDCALFIAGNTSAPSEM
jgi:hypothetical protein